MPSAHNRYKPIRGVENPFITSLTNQAPTRKRLTDFQGLLGSSTQRAPLSDNKFMLSYLEHLFATAECKEIREPALGALQAFKKVYPLNNSFMRANGTYTRGHPLRVAYMGARAGASVDWIIAALFHDTKEDGMVRDLGEFLNMVGTPRDPFVLLPTAWEMVENLTHRSPDNSKDRLLIGGWTDRKLLTPQDLSDPQVQEIYRLKQRSYQLYLEDQIYSARSVERSELRPPNPVQRSQAKVLDGIDNGKTLPVAEFERNYNYLTKTGVHMPLVRKSNYVLARQMQICRETALKNLVNMGYGPDDLPRMFSAVEGERYEPSINQRRIEELGVAITKPRGNLDPSTTPDDWTGPTIFCVEGNEWPLVLGSPLYPPTPVEIQIPTKVFSSRPDGPRDFVKGPFMELDGDLISREMKKRLGDYNIEEERTRQLPLLGDSGGKFFGLGLDEHLKGARGLEGERIYLDAIGRTKNEVELVFRLALSQAKPLEE